MPADAGGLAVLVAHLLAAIAVAINIGVVAVARRLGSARLNFAAG